PLDETALGVFFLRWHSRSGHYRGLNAASAPSEYAPPANAWPGAFRQPGPQLVPNLVGNAGPPRRNAERAPIGAPLRRRCHQSTLRASEWLGPDRSWTCESSTSALATEASGTLAVIVHHCNRMPMPAHQAPQEPAARNEYGV